MYVHFQACYSALSAAYRSPQPHENGAPKLLGIVAADSSPLSGSILSGAALGVAGLHICYMIMFTLGCLILTCGHRCCTPWVISSLHDGRRKVPNYLWFKGERSYRTTIEDKAMLTHFCFLSRVCSLQETCNVLVTLLRIDGPVMRCRGVAPIRVRRGRAGQLTSPRGSNSDSDSVSSRSEDEQPDD